MAYKAFSAVAAMALGVASQGLQAAPVAWTDWISSSVTGTSFTSVGKITTTTDSVDVTYTNPQGIQFFYTGASGETDFWTNGSTPIRNNASSPYTSAAVDNIPTGTDMVALSQAGQQTLTFSQAVANPVFSYVSLNGNGYAFDRDFTILSVGDGVSHPCGYWGCGTSSKEVVDIGGGVLEYRLIGTGEPHGTIQFAGSYSSISWRSLTSENWNGFTVGIQGTAIEVFPPAVPEPETWAIMLAGLGLVAATVRRRRA